MNALFRSFLAALFAFAIAQVAAMYSIFGQVK